MNEKGITLIALIITITVTIIIAGISIKGSLSSVNESKDNIAITELQIVGNALAQTTAKLIIAGEEPITYGEQIEETVYNEINKILQTEGMELNETVGAYIMITPDKGLKQMGIEHAEDTYVISFFTGEVFNYTKQKTKSGTILYMKAYEGI